jgi:hypothetical protein
LRKDLLLPRARKERELHQLHFSPSAVQLLHTREPANGKSTSSSADDLQVLAGDVVSAAVSSYGRLGTKIESLSQLSALPGVRAEVARLSLGRTYVARCIERNGAWTSGLHLLWWTRQSLEREPEITIDDLRGELALPLARQLELAKWSVLMLRLIFVSDMGHHAQGSDRRVASLRSLAEDAASETAKLSYGVLLRWMAKQGVARFDRALARSRYESLSESVHREPGDNT